MEKIETKTDLLIAVDYIRDMERGNDFNQLDKYPGYILEILNSDKSLLPRHLSFELFKELLIEKLLMLNPNYVIDLYSGPLIDQISRFYTEDEGLVITNNFRFSKGLLIMGKVGCGKTLILKALSILLGRFLCPVKPFYPVFPIGISFFPVYLITDSFMKMGYDIFNGDIKYRESGLTFAEKLNKPNLFIDDIGSENIVSNYGNQTNVIGELFIRRYDSRSAVFATTNLDPKSLLAFYGDRVYSRMTEMMNFIVMEGNDRRKLI